MELKHILQSTSISKKIAALFAPAVKPKAALLHNALIRVVKPSCLKSTALLLILLLTTHVFLHYITCFLALLRYCMSVLISFKTSSSTVHRMKKYMCLGMFIGCMMIRILFEKVLKCLLTESKCSLMPASNARYTLF